MTPKTGPSDEWPPEVEIDPDAFESVNESARRGRALERTLGKPKGDWRDRILTDLPEGPIPLRGATFPSAMELIKTAAFNRRISVEDFVGRAALAVAIWDSDGEHSWEEATDKEPPLRDIRRRKLPKRRLRGRGFGPWTIRGME